MTAGIVAAMMQEKIGMKVDTTAIEQEITAREKQLRQSLTVWFTINRRNMHNRCAAVSWSSMCKGCRNIG